MRALVEASGGCWHDPAQSDNWAETISCKKCHVAMGNKHCGIGAKYSEPSPTDLNALFKIAEKLECHELEFWFFSDSVSCKFKPLNAADIYGNGKTPADALRKALYKTIEQTP